MFGTAFIRCLLFGALGALSMPGVAGDPPTREVRFTPLPGMDKLPRSSQPAKLSKDDQLLLLARGYAVIGTLLVDHVVERCVQDAKGKDDCKPVPHPQDPTAELLEEAAARGGDIVVVFEDRVPRERQTGGTRPSRSERQTGYSSMVYDHGRYVPGTTTTTVVIYEKYTNKDKILGSMGTLYRLDPKGAAEQIRLNEFSLSVEDADLTRLKRFLDEGMSARMIDPSGTPVLGWAAAAGKVEAAELLLTRGAKIDAKGPLGTPLNMAAGKGQTEMVNFLLKRGASLETRDSNGSTPLFNAAMNGETDVVRVLLEAGAKPNVKNELGNTPLMAAIVGSSKKKAEEAAASKPTLGADLLHQDPEIVRLLLVKGADTKAINKAGLTPARLAEEWGVAGQAGRFFYNYWYGAYGFIDRTGKWVIKPGFRKVGNFHDGLAAVSPKGNLFGTTYWGYIDRTGRLVIPANFIEAGNFFEGLAVAQVPGDKWGLLDKTGTWVLPPTLLGTTSFREGLIGVKQAPNQWVYVDRQGHQAIPGTFESAATFQDGVAQVTKGGKQGFIDRTGKWVDQGAMGAPLNQSFSEGLRTVTDPKTKKVGYMDSTGRMVIPATFLEGFPFSEGLAVVTEDKFIPVKTYIDKTGKIILGEGWTEARRFSEGLALTMTKWGALTRHLGKREVCYIDHQGKPVLCLDDLSNSNWEWDYGYFGSSWIFPNKKSVSAGDFSEGLAKVRILEDKFLALWSTKE